MATRRARSPLVVEAGSITLGEVLPLTPEQIREGGYGLPPLEGDAANDEGPGFLRGTADSAIALGRGVAQGVRGLTDLAGTDNPVSEAIGEGISFLDRLESPERRAERERRAQTIKEAEESGSITKEISAYLGSFVEAPLDTLLEAVGSSAPTLVAAFLPGGQAAVATRIAATAGIGAAQGAGFTKRSIADSTEQGLIDAGVAPEEAKARAIEAQSFTGPNSGQIGIGGVIGAAAGRFGAEGVVARGLAKVPMAGGRAGQVLSAAAGEFATEAVQGGHEQLAGNLAQQREGLDVPLMQGVAGSAALEGVAGAGVGGGFGALVGSPHTVAEDEGAPGRAQSIGEMLAQAGAGQAGAQAGPTPGATLAATDTAEPRGRPAIRTSIDEFSEQELANARSMADEKRAATGEHQVVEIRGGALAVVPASRATDGTAPHYSTAGAQPAQGSPATLDDPDPAEAQARNDRLLAELTELAKDPLILKADQATSEDGEISWRFGALGKTNRGRRAASLLRRAQAAGLTDDQIGAAIAAGNAATKPASPRFDDPNAPAEPDANALERARTRARALAEEQGGRWVVAAVGKPEEGRYEAVPPGRLKGRRVLFEVDGGKRRRAPTAAPAGRMEPGSNRGVAPIEDRQSVPTLEQAESFLRAQRQAGQSTFGAKVVRRPDGGFVLAFPDEPEFNDPAWQVQANQTPAPTPATGLSPRLAGDEAASEMPARGRRAQGQTSAAGPASSSTPAAGTPDNAVVPPGTNATPVEGVGPAQAEAPAPAPITPVDEPVSVGTIPLFSRSGERSTPPARQADNDGDAYQTDLFGDPVPAARGRGPRRSGSARSRVPGDVQPAGTVPARSQTPADTDAPAGEYYARTFVGEAAPRKLGAAKIKSAADAARATTYLYRSAVERLDGILTDDAGKPLAVIGGFKGALTQAAVYPSTLIGEAVRVPGATRVWFSHNHPTGTAELSGADRNLFEALSRVFEVAGIEPMGMLAIGDGAFASTGVDGELAHEPIPSGRESVEVPVVEREAAGREPGAPAIAITDPAKAREVGREYYRRQDAPGVLLLDARNRVSAWMPLPDGYTGSLRGRVGRALYRAVSESNSHGAILVHGGELDARVGPRKVAAWQNVAAALQVADTRVLDSVNVATGRSASESVMAIPPAVFSRVQREAADLEAADASTARADRVREVVDSVAGDWAIADRIRVIGTFDAAPARVREENDAQLAGGASGVPGAFFHDGQIWLVADQLHSPAEVASKLYHEATHFGLRGAFGATLDPILDEIARRRPGEVRAIAKRYGLDFNNERQRRIAAEESLAAMAEANPKPTTGFVARAIAAIRDILDAVAKRLGFELELTDAQIVRNFIEPARQYARNGGKPAGPSIFGRTFSPLRMAPEQTGFSREGETGAAIVRQRRDTERAYGGRAAYDRAKNAGRTKLTYGQWVTVRTPAFKAWFGDYELANLERTMRRVRGSDQAKAVRGEIVGKPLTNVETGIVATVSGGSWGKMMSGSNVRLSVSPQAHMQALGNIDALFRLAAPVHQRPGNKAGDAQSIEAVRHFLAPMPFDGEVLQVRLLVKQFKEARDGSRIYLVEAVEIETPASDRGASTVPETRTRLPLPPAGVDNTLARMVSAVNGEGVSKATDPDTGEPQVFYHGTNADFSEFGSSPMTGGLIFFSPDPEVASSYAVGDSAGWSGMGSAEERAVLQVAAQRHPKAFRDGYLQPVSRAEAIEALEEAGDVGWVMGIADRLDAGEITVAQAVDEFASQRDALRGDSNVMPVFLNVRQPAGSPENPVGFREAERRAGSGALERAGADGIYTREGGGFALAVRSPNQVKSATGNAGSFDGSSSDIRFARSPAQQLMQPGGPTPEAVDALGRGFTGMLMQNWEDSTRNTRTFKWWRGINTQYHKATLDADFKRVFDAAQDFQKDVSRYANRAADLAPTLLPNIASARDILAKSRVKDVDMERLAEAVLQGTLVDSNPANGKVWSDAELRSRFKMNDKQVDLYHEYRAALVRALDDFGRSELISFADEHLDPLTRRQIMEAGSVPAAHIILKRRLAEVNRDSTPEERKDLQKLRQRIDARVDRIEALKAGGYAPLMRFGRNAVWIRTQKSPGEFETHWFSLHDNLREANKTAREMLASIRQDHPNAVLSQGITSDQEHKLFAGVTPDTLEVFGEEAGFSDSAEWKKLIELTRSNRSALKRMLERKRTPGFSRDMTRVLAAFVTSQGRATAGNVHQGELVRAVRAIPDGKGDVKDDAVSLHQYLQNPGEEAQAIRGLLFTWFLGGSVASAAVNLTQPLTMSLPYIAIKDGAVKGTARILSAAKDVIAGKYKPDTAKALKRAELEGGVVDPQEVHMLQAEVSRNLGASVRLRKAMFAWGYLFAAAERFNRRVTFVAAYEQAKELGSLDPVGDAERAVVDTQGIYNRANRPAWARGAIPATVMTFKQFSIAYVEFVARLLKNKETRPAGLLALGILIMLSGLSGLPFAEDLDDIVDTAAQAAGYNFQSDQAKQEFLAGLFGEQAADFALYGLSSIPGSPVDVQARLGLGNLLPGTAAFKKSGGPNAGMREMLDVFGAAGGLGKQAADATRALFEGEPTRAATSFLPVAAANFAKGLDMLQTGMYRDRRGKQVIPVTPSDALAKSIGFQPASVGRANRLERDVLGSNAIVRGTEAEIAGLWATGIFEKDQAKQDRARARLRAWNRNNPETPIRITPQQLRQRVRQMALTRGERIIKSSPREVRAAAARALRQQQE